MHPEVARYRNRLDNLFRKANALNHDFELLGHWSRYLCVLVSGYLEVAVYEIYSDYGAKRAAPEIANYVSSQLGEFQNPKMGKILTIVGGFNKEWRREIEDHPDYEEIKDAIDSIVNNRNKIAHGEDVNLSFHTLQPYYRNAVKLVEILHRQTI
ncbi:MAG: HEPN domain-containing protein [bacterium]|nr:HEPN domain-containing protein [bacterium]